MTTNNQLKSYTLSPEAIEEMLGKKFGGKIIPIDTSKEAIKNRRRAQKSTYIFECAKQGT